MTPEQKARVSIDVLLKQAGWHVCHTGAPALGLAHLDVKLAFKRVVDVDERLDVCPTQLSPQRGDNVRIREGLRKPQHVAQVPSHVVPVLDEIEAPL
jgi:hypothetical protein